MQEHYKPTIRTFVDEVTRRWGDRIEQVILFGSVAREEADRESDIDLLIVVKHEDYLLRRELIGDAYDLSLRTGYSLSVKVLSKEDFDRERNYSFLKEVLAEGVRVA